MMHITAQGFNLRYAPDEDRVLLSVVLPDGQDLSLPITRRLTRSLVDALAKIAADDKRLPAGIAPQFHETVLDFQHSQSVAEAVAEGHMRETPPPAAPVHVARLVHEVQITPKADGSLSLVFNNSEQALTIEVEAARLHIVIETFVQIADRAGWDFTAAAAWLNPVKMAPGGAVN